MVLQQQAMRPLRDTKVFHILSQDGQNSLTHKALTDGHCERNEMAVIGAALQTKKALHTASTMLIHTDFTNLQRGAIWYCIQQVADRGEAVDILSVTNEARTNAKAGPHLVADEVPAILANCIMACPNADNVQTYAVHVIEFGTRWRLAAQLTQNVGDLVSQQVNLPDILDGISSSVLQASRTLYTPQTSAHHAMTQFFERVTDMYENGTDPSILTHFHDLDEKTGGLFPSNVTVLLGESGRGKTTLSLSLIRNFLKSGYNVKHFALEMNQEEIIRILMAMETGISRTALKRGSLDAAEYTQFVEASGRISKYPLDIIDDLPSMTPAQMMRRLRMDAMERDIDVVVIDGLWLMSASQPTGSRVEDVAQIVQELTWHAKELDIPIFLLHQYKTMIGERRPTLDDFSESSKGHKTAQTIWALYHKEGSDGRRKSFLDVLKDRNGGSTGECIELHYNSQYSRYEGGGVQHAATSYIPD
jgi:replicative DNA helicase